MWTRNLTEVWRCTSCGESNWRAVACCLLPCPVRLRLRLRSGLRCSLSLCAPGRVVRRHATAYIYIYIHGGNVRLVGLCSRDRGLDVYDLFLG
jgi:hypothetical protein